MTTTLDHKAAEAAAPLGAARLRMSGIRKSFGATVALDGVDLEVRPGEVLALVGENGAGKSTLMKVLSGAHRADAGEMFLDGEAFEPRQPLDARRAGVAMIYQELSLAPDLTVAENVLLGMEPTVGAGTLVNRAEARRITADALAEVGRPDIRPDAVVRTLGIADRQLVEVARALAVGCDVLVLDEPTSSLVGNDVRRLLKLVRRLRDRGYAVVYISHFLEEVSAVSDRFTVLRDGKSVGGGVTKDATHDAIVKLMVGRDVKDLYPRSPRTPGEVVLDIDGLSSVDDRPASATLSLRRGEVVGLAGLVGSGRTELLRAVFGLRAVTGGTVRVESFTGPASPTRRWRQGMGLVSEDRKTEGLALDLSIADNLTLAGLPMFVSPRQQERRSRRWIERLGVRCRAPGQPVGALSGGNQQKVAIARLLESGADVLLLDEPTRGIDIGAKATIYGVIDELACAGKAVLMVSSYLPELLGVCDRVAVMCKGVLLPARPVEGLDEHAIMLQATGAETAAAGAAEEVR